MEGNPNVAFEACGYSKFSTNPAKKLYTINSELCLRWIQLSSILSFARFNNFEILAQLQEDDFLNFKHALNLRLQLAVFIYTYLINISKGVQIFF